MINAREVLSEEDKARVTELLTKTQKLNLGCGTDVRENFINLDIIPYQGIQIISDVLDLRFIPDNSTSFIVCQHLIEYIPRNLIIKAINEWKRVMQHESLIEFRVTNIAALTKSIHLQEISSEMGIPHELAIGLIYGKQENEFDIRRNGFTPDYFQGILGSCDLVINSIIFEDHDFIITARKL